MANLGDVYMPEMAGFEFPIRGREAMNQALAGHELREYE